MKCFRFSKTNLKLVSDMFPELEHDTRGGAVPAEHRLCIFLSYCAENGYQYSTGQLFGIKKSTVSSIVEEVADAICKKSREFIKMPTNAEMRILADKNEENFGIKNMPIAVDGCQIALGKRPKEEEMPEGTVVQNFWCRKMFWSLNVQFIGDANQRIRDVDVGWPGATHDSRVWRNCTAKVILERQKTFTIAGDTAYPISRNLVKKYANDDTDQKKRFNTAFDGLRTRASENIFGMLKMRYRILRNGLSASGLRLEVCRKVVVALACLYNMAIDFGEDQEELEISAVSDDLAPEEPSLEDAANREAGFAYRETLLRHF